MPFNPSTFVNPGQFSDYSSYSGMGGTDQMKSLKQVAQQALGVAPDANPDQAPAGGVPPQSFSEFATQAVAPVMNTFNNLSNRANQASQGNIFNAVTGQKPATQQQVASQPFNYQSAVDQIDKE
jgi:hypothetical protein